MSIPWQPEEVQVLRLAYGKLPTSELARMLERSENAIGQKAVKLGLCSGRHFTAAEDSVLRKRYPDEKTSDIARDMGRPLHAVHGRAKRLGLSKSPAFYASDKANRIQRGIAPGAVRHQFPKGHVPANKGTRRPGLAIGRMGETQFKKGRPAHEAANYVPIGTEKFDPKRKVVLRKVTDDPSLFPVKRWRPVHVIVWEAANGPVPAGHIVVFKRGQKTLVVNDITTDRLELVTLAENMRRNSYHNNYPKEVGQAIYAKTLLTRAINRVSRGNRNEQQHQ